MTAHTLQHTPQPLIPPAEAVPPVIQRGSGSIVWRPGGISVDNVVTTWTEVMDYIILNDGGTIEVDSTLAPSQRATPDPGLWDMRFASFEAYGFGRPSVVYLPEGVQLDNATYWTRGVGLVCDRTATTALLFTGKAPGYPSILVFTLGATFQSIGPSPALLVGPGEFFVLSIAMAASLAPAPSTSPLVRLTGGSTMLQFNIVAEISQNDWLEDDGTCTIVYGNTGGSSVPLPTNAGFAGTVVGPTLNSRAAGIAYDDTLVLPLLGASQVQAAIDALKGALLSAGKSVEFKLNAVYSGVPVPGFFDPPRRMSGAGTVSSVSIIRRTAGTAGDTIVDILKNGVSIFLTTGLASPLKVSAINGDYDSLVVAAFAVGQDTFVAGDRFEAVLYSSETMLAGPPAGPEGVSVVMEMI